MTIRYIAKCDLCGKEHELGFGRKLTETPGQFETPEGWQVLTYTTYTNPETGIEFRMDVMVCPKCDKAIREGRTVVSAYLDDELSEATAIPYQPEPLVIISERGTDR